VIFIVRGQPLGPLKARLASLSRRDIAGFDRICPLTNSPSRGSIGVHAARGWYGRSRQRLEASGLRCCVPKGQGQISPGQSVAPPRVVVTIGSPALKGRHRSMHRLSRPFRASSPQWIPYPGRRRRSHNSRRLALGWYVGPLQGKCGANEKKCGSSRGTESSRRCWRGSDCGTRDAKKMLATAAAAR
jgi:hypothetical protein